MKASPIEWGEIIRLKGGPCRVCGALPVSYHHLSGGTYRNDVADNIAPLCGDGTRGCHGIYTSHWTGESYDGKRRTWREVASAIRESLSPAELAYLVALRGIDWLNKMYPLPEASSAGDA